MKPDPGTYALLFRCDKHSKPTIGRLGQIDLLPGYYLYIGSAFGPGGVKARVSRHSRKSKRKHWHIDYLRDSVTPVSAWCCYELTHLEHVWAQAIIEKTEFESIDGFGCTDCRCSSHLFYSTIKPDFSKIASSVNGHLESNYIEDEKSTA